MSLTRFGTFKSTPIRTKKIRKKSAGTPILNAHGSHAKKAKKIKGTLVMSTHGSHAGPRHPRHGKPIKEGYTSDPNYHTTFNKQNNNDFNEWHNGDDANPHLGASPHNVHEQLAKDHNISQHPDAFHVTKYTANSFELNRYLHEQAKRPDDPYRHGGHEEWAEKLDGIAKKHALKTPVHVFHGAGFHPGEEAAKDPENKIHFAGFTSTSTDPGMASDFAKAHTGEHGQPHHHIIHIHLPKGHHAIVPDGEGLHPDEKEVIVGRKTTLKIHPTPDTYHTNAGGWERHYHVWHAHPVETEEYNEKTS